MSLKKRVYSVLIVSCSESFNQGIASLLSESDYNPVQFAKDISAAKRACLERSFDIVVINLPLPDESGMRFAIDICSDRETVAMILVKSELYAELYQKASESGIFILSKPISRAMVLQAFGWLISARERLRRFEKKTLSIEEKMEEIRIVNRAKWLLISELKIDEPAAHRYIEKSAMDRCISKAEVAKEIIKTYS